MHLRISTFLLSIAASLGAESDGSDPAGIAPDEYARSLRSDIEKRRECIAFSSVKAE